MWIKKKAIDEAITSAPNLREILSAETQNVIQDNLLLFVPAGRSFFANINNNVWNSLKNDVSLDPILKDFGATYESFKNFYNSWDIESNLLKKMFHGDFITEGGHDYIEHNDNRRTEISRASSGQQEFLPLGIFLEILNNATITASEILIFIEEPEAHLFPEAQRDIVYYICRVFNKICNQLGIPIKVLLTTHSPYIMSSFNNVFMAGIVTKKEPDCISQIDKILDKDMVVSTENIQAYYLKDKSTDLIDDGLINADLLDEISEKIVDDFDKILDLEK